jgi:ArsR family transcriptional regulator
MNKIDPDPSRVFKALADPNRLNLLWRLAECGTENCVGRIAACCPVDLSVISRHLAVLREAGLVTAERKGKEVRYALNTGFIVKFLRSLADSFETCCAPKKKPTQRRKSP